jgi:DNA-binding NtrC family response regulator
MNTRVMLVGRDTPFMETLNRRLAFGGFTVFFVQSAFETLAMVHNSDIDVVVVNMDDVEDRGLRLLDSIKNSGFYTEVITLTMPSAFHRSIESMKLGSFADLLIPFHNEDLAEKIQEATARKKAREKTKRSLVERFDDVMISATFAEAGEVDTARHIFKEAHRPRSAPKKEGELRKRENEDGKN